MSLLTVLAETPTITPQLTPFLELLLCAWHFVALCLCSDLAGGSRGTLLCRAGSSSDRHGKTCPESAVRNEQSGTHIVGPQTAASAPGHREPLQLRSHHRLMGSHSLHHSRTLHALLQLTLHSVLGLLLVAHQTPRPRHVSGHLEHSQDSPKSKDFAGTHLLSSKPSFVSSSLPSF